MPDSTLNEKSKKRQKKASTGKSYIFICYLFVALFMGIIAYMIYFQGVKSEELKESPYNKRTAAVSENTTRGSILAADGSVLAYTALDESGNEVRVYPYNNLFAQTVGYSDYGTSGLESSAYSTLMTCDESLSEQFSKALNGEKKRGNNVITSLDPELTQAAYDALGAHAGAVVVLDPETGEVLVDISKPDFNPNTVGEDWDMLVSEGSGSPFLNRALQGLYPPGSTFKIVTALAYYRQYGTFDGFRFNCTGEYRYTENSYAIHCINGTAHGEEDLAHAFANSCNCAFAMMAAEMLDKTVLRETAESLGLTMDLDLELPSESGYLGITQDTDTILAMQTAIGQGDTLVTPLEMAMAAQAVINGGKMIQPSFIQRVVSADGNTVSTANHKTLGTVMTPEEAEMLRALMHGVVQAGTASGLADLPCNPAGKTGTAQYGSAEANAAHSWFVGFSDTGDKNIVIAVIVEGGGDGSGPVVPVARAVFETWQRQVWGNIDY